jgi:hypothetical protein
MRRLPLGLAVLAVSTVPAAGQFTSPTVFVVRINTGDNSLVIRNTPAGSTTITGTDIVIQSTGASALSMSPTATSEGFLTVSPNGHYLGFAGYRTGTVTSGTDRVVGRIDLTSGAVNTATTIPVAEGYTSTSSNIRSAVWNDAGDRYWTAGTGSAAGIRTNTFGSTSGSIQVSASGGVTNTRVVGISGGQLYTTTASGSNIGLNTVGSGLPTTTGNAVTQVPNTGTSGTNTPSPYEFALAPNGLTLYMADDRSSANGGGIQKWTRPDTSSAFTLATMFDTNTGSTSTSGARGVAVDFSSANPTVYATTAETSANRVISFVDNGGVVASFVTLDAATTGTIYRGIAFMPVPEPGAVLGVAAGLLGLIGVIRRRARAGSAPGPRP